MSRSNVDPEVRRVLEAEKLERRRVRKAVDAEKWERKRIKAQKEWHDWDNRKRPEGKKHLYVCTTTASDERNVPRSFSQQDLDNSSTNWKPVSDPGLLSPERYTRDRKLRGSTAPLNN